jgi:hypothetical protein
MIITKLGSEALETLNRWAPADHKPLTNLRTNGAYWALECISRDHPEYGQTMDGVDRCLCGARYYPEGPVFQHRVNRIVGELREMWPR